MDTAYVWTPDQLAAVRRLRSTTLASRGSLAAAPDAVAGVSRALAHQFQREARAYGVEINPHDVKIRTSEAEGPQHQTRFDAEWAPATHTVEFTGGHLDGELIELADLNRDFRTVSFVEPEFEPAPQPTTSMGNEVTYTPHSWSEAGRWIFTHRR